MEIHFIYLRLPFQWLESALLTSEKVPERKVEDSEGIEVKYEQQAEKLSTKWQLLL